MSSLTKASDLDLKGRGVPLHLALPMLSLFFLFFATRRPHPGTFAQGTGDNVPFCPLSPFDSEDGQLGSSSRSCWNLLSADSPAWKVPLPPSSRLRSPLPRWGRGPVGLCSPSHIYTTHTHTPFALLFHTRRPPPSPPHRLCHRFNTGQ